MRKSERIPLIGAALCAAAFLAACAGAPPAGSAADLAAIDALWRTYEKANKTRDINLYASLWAEDAIKMGPLSPALVGKERILQKANAALASTVGSISIVNEETSVFGSLAYTRGSYVQFSKVLPAGSMLKYTGKFLDVLERQADGRWLILRDCYNFDGAAERVP